MINLSLLSNEASKSYHIYFKSKLETWENAQLALWNIWVSFLNDDFILYINANKLFKPAWSYVKK